MNTAAKMADTALRSVDFLVLCMQVFLLKVLKNMNKKAKPLSVPGSLAI
jgi:hypothetical protein